MEISKQKKLACFISGILSIVIGVLIIVLACLQPQTVDRIISIIIAVCLFLGAFGLILFTYVSAGRARISGTLVTASIMIAVGVFLCVCQTFIGEFIKIVLGVFLCAIGGLCAVNGSICLARKEPKKFAILYYVSAVVALALGIVILVVNTDGFRIVIYCILGGLMALSGLAAIIYEGIVLRKIRKLNKAEKKQEAVEAKEPEDKKE